MGGSTTEASSVCGDTTAPPKATQVGHQVYENYNSVCSDTSSIPRAPHTKGQAGLGRGLDRKKTYARGTPFVSETQPSSSQVPPKSSHKRSYDYALFAAANATNKRHTIGFGVYSDPNTGTQVFKVG